MVTLNTKVKCNSSLIIAPLHKEPVMGWTFSRNFIITMHASENATTNKTRGQCIFPQKLNFNSNSAKTRSYIASITVVKSFWNFAQSTAVPLPCSVQNFKMIWRPINKLWASQISQKLNFERKSYALTVPSPKMHVLSVCSLFHPTVHWVTMGLEGQLLTTCSTDFTN